MKSFHFNVAAPEKIEYAINRYNFETHRHWKILDDRLAGRKYVLGDTYSIVDMSVWGWSSAAPYLLGAETWSKMANVKRLVDEINAAPRRRSRQQVEGKARLQARVRRRGQAAFVSASVQERRANSLTGFGKAKSALPINAPITAVTPMANAPQKPTLSAGFTIGAPPNQAPSAPSATRKTNAAAGTAFTMAPGGATRRRQRWQRRADRERDGGCEGGLDRPGLSALAEAQLLARVSVESVFGHELAGDFLCELRLQASFFVDMGKLLLLLGRPLAKRAPLARQISGLGIRL